MVDQGTVVVPTDEPVALLEGRERLVGEEIQEVVLRSEEKEATSERLVSYVLPFVVIIRFVFCSIRPLP